MPTFTTRIELHKAVESDYEILHAAMEKQGFTRTIKLADGKAYKMPTAEYNFDGTELRPQVFSKAETAAKSTNKGYWILVTESAGRTFILQEII